MNIVDIVEQFVLGIVNTLSVLLSRLETFISILVEKLIATRRIKEVEADVILKQGYDIKGKGAEEPLSVSIAYPKFFAKRYSANILVHVFLAEVYSVVIHEIKSTLGNDAAQQVYGGVVSLGKTITIKLFSPDIVFSDPVTKKLDKFISRISFLAKPTDTCSPGAQKVLMSISDSETNVEYHSATFTIQVTDFSFDHVSRPILSRASTVVLGLGSFAMFILTFLEQIDKTIGLTSGTAAGVLAAVVYANFYNLYQRIRPNTP